MKKTTKILSLILAALLAVSFLSAFSTSVQADTAEELRALEEQIKQDKNNAEAQRKLAKLLLSEMKQLDDKIAETSAQIEKHTQEKAETQKRLDAAQEELDQAIADRANFQKLLDDRLAVMYMHGDSGYIDVLFGATSFSDFVSRLSMVSSIISYDKELAAQLEEAERTIQEKTDEIAADKQKLESAIANLESEERTLESQKSAKNEKMAAAQKNAVHYEALAEEKEEAAAELRRIMAGENASGDYANDFSNLGWPVPGYYHITDDFGYRTHPITGKWKLHRGPDIGAPYNAKIVAPANGKVTYAQYHSSFGNCVILDLGEDANGNTWKMLFAHANRLNVKVGQIVAKGDILSYVGSTGDSTGPHLHVELSINGVYKDPMDYLHK